MRRRLRNDFLLPHEPEMNGRFVKSSDTQAHSPPHRFDQGVLVLGHWFDQTGGSPEQGEKTMFNTIKTATLSALIGLGTLAAIPATAHADSIYLGFGNNDDPRVGVYTGDDDGFYRERRRDRDRNWRRSCSPERAVNKAERMGLRRARIVDVNRRTVKVAGRQYGDRVVIVFANERGCPVIYR
jgi:hypothetical protein